MNEFRNKIFRNEYNKSLAGVASGLAEGFDMDVTVVRLLFVLSTIFLPFSGALVYLVLWIIAPVNYNPKIQNNFYKFNEGFKKPTSGEDTKANEPEKPKEETFTKNPWEFNYKSQFSDGAFTPKNNFKSKNKSSGKLIAGVVLILIGLQVLMRNFLYFNIFDYIHKFWPVALILVGLFLLMRYKEQQTIENDFDNAMKGDFKPIDSATDNEPENSSEDNNSNSEVK